MLDFWQSDCRRIIMPSGSIGRRMCSRVCYPVEWSASCHAERWWINTLRKLANVRSPLKRGPFWKERLLVPSTLFSNRTCSVWTFHSLSFGSWGRSDVEIPNFRFWHVYNNAPEKKRNHTIIWHTGKHTTMHLRRKFVNCHNSMIVISSNWISCYCFPSLVGEDDFMFGLRFPNPFGEKNETKVPFVEAHGQGWP